jgi:hypothetical protein
LRENFSNFLLNGFSLLQRVSVGVSATQKQRIKVTLRSPRIEQIARQSDQIIGFILLIDLGKSKPAKYDDG